ncbi:MAG: hypothetical protein GXY17_05240 [Clostridiaceae bacterium]|nr:hypothetical protein [Clostridiaceae bacterium]
MSWIICRYRNGNALLGIEYVLVRRGQVRLFKNKDEALGLLVMGGYK